jgi:hypothetical protein
MTVPEIRIWTAPCRSVGFPTTHDRPDRLQADKQIPEVPHALDDLSSTDDSVATGNGFVVHAGRLHSHPADTGDRDGVDSHHSRTKSSLGRALVNVSMFEEVLCSRV